MEKQMCKDCAYYLQYYAMKAGKIFRVFCGHCTRQGVRKKIPTAMACDGFAPGETDESSFADKEYLSKELLQYVMKLELLPQIENLKTNETIG